MTLDQIAIAIFGTIAAWLSQSRDNSARRWAPVMGMIGQPFWFYAAWLADQWGILAVSVLYTLAWMRGLWVHWIAPKPVLRRMGTLEFPPQSMR